MPQLSPDSHSAECVAKVAAAASLAMPGVGVGVTLSSVAGTPSKYCLLIVQVLVMSTHVMKFHTQTLKDLSKQVTQSHE